MAERKQLLLRISPQLWAELSAWAQDEFRSINGQIEYVLQEAVRQRRKKGFKDETTDEDS
ncbi:MAG: Arc family DNA binding domain-containing protein [Armatimonadetes bacterium]|nr:Arc family DNA binding domain-containing protein [Armatimonadota bacterium]